MPTLRIASFNLHWGGLQQDGDPYDALSVCRELDADVLVLQEMWRETAPGWFETLRAAYPHAIEFPLSWGPMRKRGVVAPAMGHWGIAVVSRYPIRTVGELPLGEVPLDPVEHRRALHLELDVDGSLCDLVATHISAITILGPALQLRRLGPQLPHDATRPAIVVGDLNVTWPVIRSCIGPGFRRAVVGATWPSSHLVCQIDHLLVNDAVRVLDSAITRHVGSDHRPITATLAW